MEAMAMAIAGKDAAREVMEHLPDDATLADIRYALYVRESVERGLRDVESGNMVSHEEVKRELAAWRASLGRARRAETPKASSTT
jgi:predicted transcriptional regulator